MVVTQNKLEHFVQSKLACLFLLYSWLSLPLDILGTTDKDFNIFHKFSEVLSVSLLPDYVVANISNLCAIQNTSIRRQAPIHNFPLTGQDKIDIKVLETKFEKEKDCAGLAAPQIGISKRFIVFKVEKEDGVPQTFPKTIWINPSYKKASEETELAYEQCFSVKGVTAPVRRYKYIHFTATDMNGSLVQGKAEGFSARVIQHETDHLNGILFIDLVPKEKIISIEEFNRRIKKYEKEEKEGKL